jgi:DNA repair protein RadC
MDRKLHAFGRLPAEKGDTRLRSSTRPMAEDRKNRPVETSDHELLALVIGRCGPGRDPLEAARRMIDHAGDLSGLASRTVRECAARAGGLSPSAASRVEALLELARRLSRGADFRPEVTSPEHAAREARDLVEERRELMVGLFLDARCRLIARETIAVGSLNVARASPRDVLEPAVRLLASGIVIVHNHPSGDVEPSDDDVRFTGAVGNAAELLGVSLHDHVVVGRSGFVSLRARRVPPFGAHP